MRKLCVFDTEVLKNIFICCIKATGEDIVRFEISARRNDFKELCAHFLSNKFIYAGHNCIHYDTPIINYLLLNYNVLIDKDYKYICEKIKELSDIIIDSDDYQKWTKYKFANYFPQIDTMTMIASKELRVGLKSLQISMCYHNVEEMTIDWHSDLPEQYFDTLIMYCDNDVLSTTHLLRLAKDDLQLRQAIQKEFDINCLSKDGVGIGVDIFTKYICEYLGLSNPKQLMQYRINLPIIRIADYLCPIYNFKTKPLQDLLKYFQELILDATGALPKSSKSHLSVTINNLTHSLGIGGLHSVNKPAIYVADENYILRDKDVTSYYPSLSEHWGFGPKGFLDTFISVIKFLKAARVEAKKAGDKVKDSTYKLALNSILGNLRNEYSPYYAPEANLGISINGQLMLLMLIEECELNGIECISSNTDGATFKIHKDKVDLFEEICTNWEKVTKMGLEAVDYEKMVILAVNDYIAFKKGYNENKDKVGFSDPTEAVEISFRQPWIKKGTPAAYKNDYVKEKGFFLTHPRLGKGLENLIIPKALQEYFGKGIPIEETIRNFKSIYDYISFQKVGRQFDVFWGGEKQQHINRYYVRKTGPYLKKAKLVHKLDKNKQMIQEYSYSDLLSGFGVQLVNKVNDPNDIKAYDINYQYYIAKAREIIHKLEPAQLTLF